MSLRILCAGYLVRHPLGGHSWHHLQYLVGLKRLGHDVTFFEHYGWPDSCYDPRRDEMTSDPAYGIAYISRLFQKFDLDVSWCYLAEDGTTVGMSRERLARECRECDLFLNLSNMNWIPELENCRHRVLVDTDPVFTQIGCHGNGGPFSRYERLFTYGENVHRAGCEMPTGDIEWLPTRQPVVLDAWPVQHGDLHAPFTTVINWTAYGDHEYEGRIYGQKDREFEAFFSLPRQTGTRMEIAVNAPESVTRRLTEGGWEITDPMRISRDPWVYQSYLASSTAEFCVAKHGYVSTRCGWFSDRSSAYLASGRPVLVQDTGFSHFLPTGEGLLCFSTPEEAIAGIQEIKRDYHRHSTAAREIAENYFASDKVLTALLDRSMSPAQVRSSSEGIHANTTVHG